MKLWCRTVGACLFVSASLAVFADTEPNSFINRPANTLPELLNQVRTDKQVASRYMRHFGMTKEEVVDYFSKLKLGRLPADGVYLVYNVPDWEEVRARALQYRKGTLVWQDQDNRPILKASCGNPMVRGTDIGLAAATPGVKMAPSIEVRDLVAIQSPETAFIEQPPTLLAPGQVEANAAEMLPVNPPVPVTNRMSGVPFILPVVAGLLVGLGKGETPPVPEPTTMVVLGGGLAVFVAKRRKKD